MGFFAFLIHETQYSVVVLIISFCFKMFHNLCSKGYDVNELILLKFSLFTYIKTMVTTICVKIENFHVANDLLGRVYLS